LLLNLTAELRCEIYRLVIISRSEFVEVVEAGYARPALLNTCKEVYLEATSIL
jgi:hypothetical protein